MVVHVDQHANDFNTLFDVLHGDPERYSMGDPSVFLLSHREVVLRERLFQENKLTLRGAPMPPSGSAASRR